MISAKSFCRFSFLILVLGNVFSFTQYKTIFENEQEHDGHVTNLKESAAIEYSTATTTLRTTVYISDKEILGNSSTNAITSIQTEFDPSMTTQKPTLSLDEEKKNYSEAIENTNNTVAFNEIKHKSTSTTYESEEESTTRQSNLVSGEKKEETDARVIEKNASNETQLNKHETTIYPSHTTNKEIRIDEKKQNFRSNQNDDISISGSNNKNGVKNKLNVDSIGIEYNHSTTEPITTVYFQSSLYDGYNSNEDKKTYTQFKETIKHTTHTTETIKQENRINGIKTSLAMYRNDFHKWNKTETETSTASSNGAFGEITQKTSSSPAEDENDENNEFDENRISAWIKTSKTSNYEKNSSSPEIDENKEIIEETEVNNSTTKQTTSTQENVSEITTIKTIKTRSMILNELRNHTTVVDIKNHPYIVSIQKDMIHSCCGTIISSSWILTTSHCLTQPGSDVQLVDTTKIAVVAGQSQLGLGKMQLRRVKNLFLHNRFVKKMLLNDIGMINLYEPFELNDYVNVVLLSSSISKPYKFFSSCYVISWTVYRKDFLSFDKLRAEDEKTKKLFKVPELQLIELPTITYEECCDRIEAKDFITRNQICTEYGTYKNVSCPADAGSPLICGERQYGIFSWGIGCEDDDYPGVFAKVSSFRKWINNVEMDPNVYILRNKGISRFRLTYSMMILMEMLIFMIN